MIKHISLFGGPSTGKSTTSAELFARMKRENYKVELVTEYAKDLVYSKDFMTLSDQIMVLAKQHHKWFKLEDQVEWTVSDAPFLLSSVYVQEKPHLNKQMFVDFIVETYKRYDTINIFLLRSDEYYQSYGRNETLQEAKEIDDKILTLLEDNDIEYHLVKVGENTINDIMGILKLLEK